MNQTLIAEILAFLDSLKRLPELNVRNRASELAAKLRSNHDYSHTLGFKRGEDPSAQGRS